MNRYIGKHVIITGGSSGIGKAMSLRFASEGAIVHIFDIDDEATENVVGNISKSGGKAFGHNVNVASSESVIKAYSKISYVDLLINNAGVSLIGNIESTTSADMDRAYDINVKGVYHCTYHALPSMRSQGKGVILNLASVASRKGLQDRFAYSMSKGAVFAMTMSVAKDYVGEGIRCNCICPARVHTPFVDSYLDMHYSHEKEEMYKQLAEHQPIGRMGKPEEIAGLAAFLCSDEAEFITGSAYDIDGGVTNLI